MKRVEDIPIPGTHRPDPPLIDFYCYICGRRAQTYRGCLTVPPDYRDIKDRHHIRPVSTCSEGDCAWREQLRQDAVFNYIVQRDEHREKV